jgi:hypothetical protein
VTALDTPINVDELTFAAMFLPPLIAVINRLPFSRETRTAAAVAVCLIFGLLMGWLRGELDMSNWRPMLIQAAIGAVVMHRVLRQSTTPAETPATTPALG